MTTTTSTPTPSTQGERLRALAGERLARDRWSRDRLLTFQAERLRALIAHAVAASPWYRDLLGPDAAVTEGDGFAWTGGFLGNRALSIAGGTSEIQRSLIAERLLRLPKDP